MRARGTWMAVALLGSLSGACRKSEAPPPQASAAPGAPAAEAPATGAAPEAGAAPEVSAPAPSVPPIQPQGQSSIPIDIGLGGDPENGVRNAGAIFPPGSSLTAGVDASGLPVGAILKATWTDARGRKLREDHQAVEGGVRWLLFKALESADWSEGTYRVDFLVSTGGSASRTFQIAPGTRPQATPIPG